MGVLGLVCYFIVVFSCEGVFSGIKRKHASGWYVHFPAPSFLGAGGEGFMRAHGVGASSNVYASEVRAAPGRRC